MRIAYVDALIMLIISLVVFGLLFYWAVMLRKPMRMRKLAAVEALEEGINRAVEMGKSVHIGVPLDTISSGSGQQSLSIIGYLARSIARKGIRGIYSCTSGDMVTAIRGVVRETYVAEGKTEDFDNPAMCKVFCLPGVESMGGYATWLCNVIPEENVGTNIILGLQRLTTPAMGEICRAANTFSVVSCPEVFITIALCIVSFDYTILLNEYYATGAYLTQEPAQLASVSGMDIIVFGMILAIIIGAVAVGAGWRF